MRSFNLHGSMLRSILSISIGMLLCLAIGGAHASKVYQWTDAEGRVHFSDKPTKGAKKLELSEPQTYKPVDIPQTKSLPRPQPNAFAYDSLRIISPKNEAFFPNNNTGSIEVSIQVYPNLRAGDTVEVFLDNDLVGELDGETHLSLSIDNIDRGEHQLLAQLVDSRGTVLLESEEITFFMQRPITRGPLLPGSR